METERSLHDLLLAAVERAAELQNASEALRLEQQALTGELREAVAQVRERREALRALSRRRP
jgi:hypothetical protein